MDIGVSPAAPAVAREHPGKGTRCLDAAVWGGPNGSDPGSVLSDAARRPRH